MIDEIGYEEVPEKKVLPMHDAETQQLKEQAIKGIEKKQMIQRTKAEMGINEIPAPEESVPKEVPALFFKFGSKVLKCEKFRTDDEENKLVAKHLSIIIGSQNSKIWSVLVIIIIVISKVTDCMDAVRGLLGRKKETQIEQQNKTEQNTKNPNKKEGDWL